MRPILIRLCWFSGFLLLAACQPPPTRPVSGPPDLAAWEQRRGALEVLRRWELEGRVGIVAGEESGSGSLDWRQNADRVEFEVSGPFGMGGFSITGDDQQMTLRTGDGELTTANLEAELAWRLGYVIPVSQLRYWVRGLPAPGAVESLRVDAAGRLRELRQAGWYIEYQDYQQVGSRVLPARLSVQGEGVRLKLAIGEWRLLTADGAGS